MKTLGFSPWGNGQNIFPFDMVFDEKTNCGLDGLSKIDALVLWGGTDIHPSFYGQTHNRFSGAPTMPSDRDLWEWRAMKYCKAHGIPMIGVCRGAQFLCAFAGGKLLQHVAGHTMGDHDVMTSHGELFTVTSSHHQMLDVHGTNHELLAWSDEPLSRVYYGQEAETPAHLREAVANKTFKEPEIVFFPDIKALAIQGHPEWSTPNSRFVSFCNEAIAEYLFAEEWA